ncbi:ABC transporter substrate-binding protein [Nocardia sp. alder85J]|uniref:ABC transporter substrate-binding protein n=1 Tax=Nocardia sp. alder85J TaxID=2862949 RepID=UPI001CD6BD18|nr:ABC transporter substrate-binding protein [Nocardia sp. alder85J]MCX4095612.1 ABC transporter substrate-binding protein [Nocardia sp. alder85J]
MPFTRRSMRFIAAVTAVFAAVAVSATACGSRSGEGGNGTATGTPIKFYVIGPSGNDKVDDSTEGVMGVRAAITAINNAGGVLGHPLQAVYCGNGPATDANKVESCSRDAANDPGISALAWTIVNQGASMDPTLEKAGLACLGCHATTSSDYSSPIFFDLGSGALSVAGQAALAADVLHAKQIAMALPDLPAAHALPELIAQLALDARNLKVGKAVYIPLTSVDMTAAAAQMNGADNVLSTLLQNQAPAFVQAMKQQGINNPTTFLAGLFGAPGLTEAFGNDANGLYLVSRFNYFSPGYQAYARDVAAIGATDSVLNNDQSLQAWMAVRLFAHIVQQLGGNPTRESVLNAVRNLTSYSTDGLTPDIDFSKPQARGGGHFPNMRNDTVTLMQYRDGRLQAVGAGNFVHVFG